MFIWVEGPAQFDAEKLYWQAVARKTAFVPGKFFFVNRGEGNATMRLNFTMTDEQTIDRAIHVIAELIEQA